MERLTTRGMTMDSDFHMDHTEVLAPLSLAVERTFPIQKHFTGVILSGAMVRTPFSTVSIWVTTFTNQISQAKTLKK